MEKGVFARIKRKFILWLGWRLPDCRTITPTLGESLDRRLSLRERIEMRLHLFTCEKCGRYLKNLKFLSKAMKEQENRLTEAVDANTAKLSIETKDRFKNVLNSSMGGAF
ncbi:MAG: zf-HC2 domain-containing protein [Acidobacteria bacterium]|nr:zf-HC2 domain-containing protein [Acidobacteriota bacterium]